jgi:hypothetical protein
MHAPAVAKLKRRFGEERTSSASPAKKSRSSPLNTIKKFFPTQGSWGAHRFLSLKVRALIDVLFIFEIRASQAFRAQAMKIASWNVGGLRRLAKSSNFKSWCSNFDIIFLQETMKLVSAPPLSIPGFSLHYSYAVRGERGRPIGGLVSCVSHNVANAFEIEEIGVELKEAEALLLKLTRRRPEAGVSNVIFFLNLYVPALPKKVSFNGLRQEIEELIDDVVGSHSFFLGGDFNAHYVAGARATPRDRDFSRFADFVQGEGFHFFPELGSDVPSFISAKSATLIDFTCSRGLKLKSSGSSLYAYEASGHRAVVVELDFPRVVAHHLAPRHSHRKHLSTPPPSGFFPAMSKAHGWSGPVEILRVGVSLVFTTLLAYLGSFLFTVRAPDRSAEPWHRYLSFGELRDLAEAETRVKDLSNRLRLGDSTVALLHERRSLISLTALLQRRAAQRFGDTIESSKTDHTLLWKTLRNFRLDPEASQGLPVDALCAHFSNLFNRDSDVISLPFVYPFLPFSEELDVRFTMAELEVALGELRTGSAPGPSGVGNDVILGLTNLPGFKRLLLNLFNGCLEGGSIPAAWSHCEMFILYKGKGDPLLPASYRAIALLDSFFKLYERLLCRRLVAWANAREIIPAAQFGFRSGSSTLDAVFCFWKLIFRYVTVKKGFLFAALIDFKSAFPSVDRNLLFKRLSLLGVSRKFACALHSLFEKNTFQLRLSDEVTDLFPVTTGLRKGSVLSPILFSIFISDLEHEVLGPFPSSKFLLQDCEFEGVLVNGLLFADDLIIFARSGQGLRYQLRLLEKYVDRQKLTVNVNKCEIVRFGKEGGAESGFKFKGQVVPENRKCKYLGILFDQEDVLQAHENALVVKFQNALGGFFKLARHMRLSELPVWSMLQDSLLFSILYGSEFVDGHRLAEKLDPLYRKALRAYIGLPNQVSNNVLSLLFPRFSFKTLFLKKKCSYLQRMTLPSPTLASVFFVEDRTEGFPKNQGFSADLKTELATIGVEELAWNSDKGLTTHALAAYQLSQRDKGWTSMSLGIAPRGSFASSSGTLKLGSNLSHSWQ